MVVWLMGLSGSGKTTLGTMLKEYFDERGVRAFMMDGDRMRDFFDGEVGYTEPERLINVKRVMLAAYLLGESGTIAIVCNIHPFAELRAHARRKIPDYNEIWLKCDIERCRTRDVKRMYREHEGRTHIIGLEVRFDEPRESDLVIDTGKETVEESFGRILAYLRTRYPEIVP